jgi:hypothetical protein
MDYIPNISVDCVVFGFDQSKLNVMLSKRELKDTESKKVIFTDYTVLGHHVLVGENIDDAAIRVLKDKTGLDNIYLKQFQTFGDLERMKNEKDQVWIKKKYPMISDHVISVGYYSLVDSTKIKPDQYHESTKWFPVDKLPELGFDHEKMIHLALEFLRRRLKREPIGFELLPEKFTISQMQKLYECVFGTKFDRRNFRKKVTQMKYLIPLDEKQKGVAHKPAQVFIFSRDVYDRTKSEKLDFSI